MPEFQDVEFIRTELKTGLTFSNIALQAKDAAKISRNTANARKAYDTLLRFMDRSMLSDEDLAELDPMLLRLKTNLLELGEMV